MGLRDIVSDFVTPLCRHDHRRHLELLLLGHRKEPDSERADELADRWRSDECVLELFVNGPRFLCRQYIHRFYVRFLELWTGCDPSWRECVSTAFRRASLSKPLFVLLAYVHLTRVVEAVARCVMLPGYGDVQWEALDTRLLEYAPAKLNALLENVCVAHLQDLHAHLFGAPFVFPVQHQMSSPCLSLLRAREYDGWAHVEVVHRRRRARALPLEGGEARLWAALRRFAGEAPCGNPMYAMLEALVDRFCRQAARYLIPLRQWPLRGHGRVRVPEGRGGGGGDGAAGATASAAGATAAAVVPRKTGAGGTACWGGRYHGRSGLCKITQLALSVALGRGLANSVVDLPVWCYCKTKCERGRSDPHALLAVVCEHCGHCLNLGKERLSASHGFPLNSVFYYRDRQEKTVVHSSHGDDAHCSLCGSQCLSVEPIYRVSETVLARRLSVATVRWRAVTGSNSACAVYGRSSVLDVLVPCSSRSCFGTVVVRRVTADRLLRLVSHQNDFVCPGCKGLLAETCLDRDEEAATWCRGCAIYQRFRCGGWSGRDLATEAAFRGRGTAVAS